MPSIRLCPAQSKRPHTHTIEPQHNAAQFPCQPSPSPGLYSSIAIAPDSKHVSLDGGQKDTPARPKAKDPQSKWQKSPNNSSELGAAWKKTSCVTPPKNIKPSSTKLPAIKKRSWPSAIST